MNKCNKNHVGRLPTSEQNWKKSYCRTRSDVGSEMVNMDYLYRVGAGGTSGRKFVASLSLGRLKEENFHRLEEPELFTHMTY